MAKPRKNKRPAVAGMRSAYQAAKAEANRDGRRERAATIPDRRKVENRNACRGKVAY